MGQLTRRLIQSIPLLAVAFGVSSCVAWDPVEWLRDNDDDDVTQQEDEQNTISLSVDDLIQYAQPMPVHLIQVSKQFLTLLLIQIMNF
jgi:hypothetical protein